MATPAFTLPVEVAALPSKGRDYTLIADETAREALARELGLESLGALKATFTVTPAAGNAVDVKGRFDADVVQACVVTLKPVPSHLSEEISRRFVPQSPTKESKRESKRDPKREPDDEEGDWVDPNVEAPDPLVDGILDLGEVVTEQLALALDPYPRVPGATFEGLASGNEEGGANSPFAALAGLKVGKAAPRRAERKDSASPKARPGKGKTAR